MKHRYSPQGLCTNTRFEIEAEVKDKMAYCFTKAGLQGKTTQKCPGAHSVKYMKITISVRSHFELTRTPLVARNRCNSKPKKKNKQTKAVTLIVTQNPKHSPLR